MPKAEAASRTSFKLTVTLGLVSVQFGAYKLVEERKVERKMFGPSGSPVKQQLVDSGSGEIISFEQVVKKYQTESGALVPLNDAEMVKAAGFDEVTGSEFVGIFPVAELQERFLPSEFYAVRAADKHGIRPAALILGALDDQAILVRFVNRGRERLAMLDGTGLLTVLHFEDEVRERPKPSTAPVLTVQEQAMALQLISAYSGSVKVLPEQRAEAAAQVEKFAQAKAAGMPQEAPQEDAVPIGDLMAQLMASVEKAKAGV